MAQTVSLLFPTRLLSEDQRSALTKRRKTRFAINLNRDTEQTVNHNRLSNDLMSLAHVENTGIGVEQTMPKNSKQDSDYQLIIEPSKGLQLLDCKELYAYRDLFRFLVWRQIRVRYAQSVIGVGWAIIQPLFSMLIFTVVFGKLAKIDSDGSPYALFSMAALLPWTYFSNAVNDGVASLVSEANMLRKIYFPRLLMPISAVAAQLLDFMRSESVV